MEISRRGFLNRSAVTLVTGVALSSFSAAADGDTTFVPLPDLKSAKPPAPSVPTKAATTTATPSPQAPLPNAEGSALATVAVTTVGYPLTDEEKTEVTQQLVPYPDSVKAFRSFSLVNSNAPNMDVTPSFRASEISKSFKLEM